MGVCGLEFRVWGLGSGVCGVSALGSGIHSLGYQVRQGPDEDFGQSKRPCGDFVFEGTRP